MTKNGKSDESILARFEKLFAKGSFQAARREIAKGRVALDRPDLLEKLRVCDEAIAEERTKETLKKARRCLKQSKLAEALALFTAAYETKKEDWIENKICELQATLKRQDDETAATAAEQSGDFITAAEIYGRQDEAEGGSSAEDLLRRAHCLVMAHEWEAAISAYHDCEPKSARDKYDLGLAQAMTGRYLECLGTWADIASPNEAFIAQREAVCALLESACLSKTSPDNVTPEMYHQLKALFRRDHNPCLGRAVTRCRSRLLARCWREERYDEILTLLDDADDVDGALLDIAAKASFLFVSDKKNEPTAAQLVDFAMYWLSALYHPEIWMQLSTDREESLRTRQRLVDRGESLVRRRMDASNGDRAKGWSAWQSERALTEELYALVHGLGDPPPSVCTPRFAARFNKTDAVLDLLAKRSDLLNDDAYLNLGAHYSKAAPAIFHAHDGNLEKASEMLQELEGRDPFSEAAARRAAFACGLSYLEATDEAALKHFKMAAPFLKTSRNLADHLIQKALEAEATEAIDLYKKTLEIIVNEHPSPGLKRALSTVRTRLAIARYNTGRMNDEAMNLAIERALELDPSNEEAILALKDTRANMEIRNLRNAVARHKMTRACEIVERAAYPEIREVFFTMMEDIHDRFIEDDLEAAHLVALLMDLHHWCERIDPTHPLLDEIRAELDDLKRNEPPWAGRPPRRRSMRR